MVVTAIIFLAILSFLVFIHEFGHYAVARLIGVKVEEFGFGLPPRIFGKKIGGTTYSINWLAIGGFVRLAGEDDEHEKVKGLPVKQYFWARSKKERAAILLAGVVMNFLLAAGITSYLMVVGLTVPDNKVTVKEIQSGSPAQKAGLLPGDIIAEIRYQTASGTVTKALTNTAELKNITNAHLGEAVTLTIMRKGVVMAVSLTTRRILAAGEGPIGITITDVKIAKYPWWSAPWEAFTFTLLRAKEMLVGVGTIILRLVTLKPVGADVAGPIGIAQVTGQAVKFGVNAVLEFMSILSLNLAVLNVLPVPALDGGRLLFVFVEKILGHKVAPAFERSTHQIGMLILFLLIFLVSINDILRLAGGG